MINSRRRIYTGMAALSLLAGFASISPSVAQDDAPPLAAGTKAPAFTTTTIDGKHFSLASLRGHVVLLDFWATWCGPCQMATPTLESLSKTYKSKGLRVVGISVDDPSTAGQVKGFMKHFGITYTISASPAANAAAARRYNANGIPSQYVIDKKGIVRWSQAGYAPGEGVELARLITKLNKEHG